MPAGQAYGQDRDYQILCRDIFQQLNKQQKLKPYDGDGIDVKFEELGGTGISFDVALINGSGDIVVAECRRRMNRVKQSDVFAFAHTVELLRKTSENMVAGLFFTKSQYQIGAVKHANWIGVDVIVLNDKSKPTDFVLSYQKYDVGREKRLQEILANMTGTIQMRGTVSAVLNKKDGSKKII